MHVYDIQTKWQVLSLDKPGLSHLLAAIRINPELFSSEVKTAAHLMEEYI